MPTPSAALVSLAWLLAAAAALVWLPAAGALAVLGPALLPQVANAQALAFVLAATACLKLALATCLGKRLPDCKRGETAYRRMLWARRGLERLAYDTTALGTQLVLWVAFRLGGAALWSELRLPVSIAEGLEYVLVMTIAILWLLAAGRQLRHLACWLVAR